MNIKLIKTSLVAVFFMVLILLVPSCKDDENEVFTANVAIADFNTTIAENPTDGEVLGTPTATTDRGSIVFSITDQTPANAMDIDATSGELSVADAFLFDYEANSVITAIVNASVEGVSETANITINLNDVPETVTTTKFETSIDENPNVGLNLGTITATTDGGASITYSLLSGLNSSSFAVEATTGEVTVADVSGFDYETNTVLKALYKADNGKVSEIDSIIINLNDVAEAVNASPFTVAIDENPGANQVLGTVSASSGTGATLSYSMVSGGNATAFAINATTGELTVADVAQFDFETNPTLSANYEVSDGTASAQGSITVNLNDVSEAVNASPFTVTIDENPSANQVLGTVSASSGAGATLSYSMVSGGNATAFAINATTGELTVADVAQFDFETNPTLSANYEVTDGTSSAQGAITITLNDLPDFVTANPFTVTIDENPTNGQVLGTVSAITDAGATLTYSMVSGQDATAFAIDEATGELTVADIVQFDFETNPTLSASYEAKNGTTSAQGSITVTLNDLQENSVVANDFVASIAENSTQGTVIGTVDIITTGTETPIYSIDNQSISGAVSIDANGQLVIADATVFDYEVNVQITGSYEVVFGNVSDIGNFTINLIDLFSWNRTLFAGAQGAFGNRDGAGIGDATFNEPRGMAFDASGNLYVADKNNHRIRKIDANANVTTLAGTTQGFTDGSNAQFNFPHDVEVDANGNVWVADNSNQTLRYIDPSGNTSSIPQALNDSPFGIAISGNIVYVGQQNNIVAVDVNTKNITGYIVGGAAGYADGAQPLFQGIRGIAVNSGGEILVADNFNRKVRKVNTSQVASTYPGSYFEVSDVAVAPDGNIYAVETGNKRVRIVTNSAAAADEIIATGFTQPEGIAVHPTTGDIYIADTRGYCIYKLTKVQE